VGVGVGGVGGTIRLWRTALFYGGSRSREYQVGIAWVACLAPSVSTNQQKHIHYTFISFSGLSFCERNIVRIISFYKL